MLAPRDLPCSRRSPRAADSDRTRPAFSFRVLDRRRRRPKPTCVSSWKATRFSPFSRPSSCVCARPRTFYYLYAGFRNSRRGVLFGASDRRQFTDELNADKCQPTATSVAAFATIWRAITGRGEIK